MNVDLLALELQHSSLLLCTCLLLLQVSYGRCGQTASLHRGGGHQGSEEFRYSFKVTRQGVVELEPGLHPCVLSPHQ